MKLKVLFSYSTQVVPPRCRNPRTVVHHDGVLELEIKELSPTDAPVAVELHKTESIKVDNKFVDRRTVVPYRLYEGELWTNCRMFNCNRSSHTSGKRDWNYERAPKLVDMRVHPSSIRTQNYRLHLTLDCFSSKADIELQLRAWADGWFILKGRPGMWSTAGEPRYVVMTFGLGSNHGGTSLMLDDSYNGNISKNRYFNALELAEAKACARKIAKGRGDNKSLPIQTRHGRIKVLMPEAIKCVPQTQAGEGDPFINKLESVVSSVKNPGVAGLLGMMMAVAEPA